MAFLKKIKFGESPTNIAKTVVNGAPSGVIAVTDTQGYENNDSEEKDYSYDIDVRVDDATIVKDGQTNKVLKVGTVPAAQVSVAAGGHTEGSEDGKIFNGDYVEDVLTELNTKIDNIGGAAKSYTIVKETTGLDANVKEQYKLQQTVGSTNTFVGETIKIYKDSSLKSVELVDQELVFTYILDTGTESVVRVDVSKFLAESEFADGLQVTDHVVSVKIDSTSEKDSQSTPVDFLTVGTNGVKISGIKNEIDRKIAALDVTGTVSDGQYVSSVSEADGIVSTTKANVSDAVLNGYEKGTKPASTAIAATDDVKGAIAKLEHQIDDAKAAATTKVEKDANASHLTLTNAAAADGSVTYTIGESDIASKTDLDAEIAARKAVDGQNGQTYAANDSANYISGATSLNDADVKLDAAIKAEADRAKSAETAIDSAVGLTKAASGETRSFTPTTNYGTVSGTAATTVMGNMQNIDTKLKEVADGLAAVQYKVTGTTLEFFGMTEHA